MSLRPLTTVDGDMYLPGVYDYLVFMNAGYHANQGMVENFLARMGGGDILLWRIEREGDMPSYICIRQGLTYVFLNAGIVNLQQLLGAILGGATGTPYFLGGNVAHSYFWYRWADLQRPDVDSVLATAPANATFYVVGHSGGYPTGLYLAQYIRSLRPSSIVRVFGLGGCKAMTVNYRGPAIDSHHRVRHPYDLVCYVPPDLLVFLYPTAVTNVFYQTPVLHWTHYGVGWILDDNGDFSIDPLNATGLLDLPISQFSRNPELHSLDHYLDRIELYLTRSGEIAQVETAKDIRTLTDAAGPIAPDPPNLTIDKYIFVPDFAAVHGVTDTSSLTRDVVATLAGVVPAAVDVIRSIAAARVFDSPLAGLVPPYPLSTRSGRYRSV